ncbi:MAG TPA: YbjN domain-containing protein [Ktedonobacteraceae bacterium]|nr:YbjN domain-containing protein [Ktedonobacteraceae bacterium]
MADSFGIPQVIDYLTRMGLQIASMNPEQEIVELAFHGNHGQWRLIISLQQSCQARKLVLVAPHISAVTRKKRLQCLEALMAVNYRIAMGKFGLDLDDGEVRLEESVPLANDSITYDQFQLAFRAMVQTVAMYHSLIPRIIYGNLSTQEALQACEQEFFQDEGLLEADIDEEYSEEERNEEVKTVDIPRVAPADLNIHDVMEEVTRLLEERKES